MIKAESLGSPTDPSDPSSSAAAAAATAENENLTQEELKAIAIPEGVRQAWSQVLQYREFLRGKRQEFANQQSRFHSSLW